MTPKLVAALILATASICATVVEAVRRFGSGALLDIPNDRSSHETPTPRGGGLGIVVGAVVPWGVWAWVAAAFPHAELFALLAAIGAVTVVSWVDDLRGVRFPVRLLVHVVAAASITAAFGPFREVGLPGIGGVRLSWLGWPLSLVWLVGLTNAYNFMDGIDGIAGGVGVVAGLAWWRLAIEAGVPAVGILALLLGVGCGVFLCFNWSPARIFMGDVGSAPLGLLYAALPLMAAHSAPTAGPWVAVAGAAGVWPFVFDASYTFVRRLRRGDNVFAAHRTHLYQRMVIAGWSHRRVSGLYVVMASVSGIAGVISSGGGAWRGMAGIAAAIATAMTLWLLTLSLEGAAR